MNSPASAAAQGSVHDHSFEEILKGWIAAGLWIGIIVVESTSYLSSDNTGHILFGIFHHLFGISPEHFHPLHVFIRKGGHFVGYAMLSFLLFRAWKATLPSIHRWALKWSAIAFFMTALVASLDEWHQTYIPSRTGTLHDVFLDSFAALTMQVVIAWFLLRPRKS
ncbi:MAG TPA: VanZ family protein [Terriglobales bacterium]